MKVSKKLITKSIITTMLTLGMMFALAAFIPGSVLRANAETNYPLYIGGYQFTSSRLVIDSSVDSAFSGSATYDPGSNTLMLNNFNNGGKVSEEGNKCYGMRYQGNDDLMICIVGNNTITTDTIPSVGPSKWGIISQSDQADITFQGTTIDDSLSVYSGDSILSSVITQSIGIEAAGNMLINDCSINAIAGNANSWIGGIKIFDSGHPFAHLNLTVDHACVTARGGNLLGDGSVAGDRFTATVGIHSNYSIIIQNESIVVASAGTKNKTDSSSDGISASNEIQISNSKVDAAAQGGIAIYNTFKNEVPGLGWTNFLGTEGETSIQVNPSGQTHYTFQKVHFAPINTVTVTNGTCVGGDDHEYGETVTITANAPAAGYVFDHWSTSSGVTFANANSSTTTFAMPAAPVSVTANYRELDRATVAQIPTAKTGLTVNGSAQALINGGSATGGTLVYALGNADSATGTYSETIPTEMNAGTYYVWYKVVGDSNHNDTEAKMLTVQIAEKKNENDDPNKPDPDNPDTPDPKPAAIPVTSISLNITDASVTLKKGATLTLTAAVLPENASDKSVEWSVVDPSVASVSGGTVTANDKGKTKVTVTTKDGGFTASCQILVVSDELLPEVVEKIEPDKTYTDEADKPVAPAPEVPEPVKVSDEVTIPLTYGDAAVTYNGQKADPEKQLGAKIDLSTLATGLTIKDTSKTITDLVKVEWVVSGKDSGERYFYPKLKVTNAGKSSKVLSKKDRKKLANLVKKANKELKKKGARSKYTVNKRSLTDGVLSVKVQMKNDAIKTKKGKVSKVKSIKLEIPDPSDATKTITVKVPAKNYKIEVVDAKAGLVRVKGLKNFTGSVTVYVER